MSDDSEHTPTIDEVREAYQSTGEGLDFKAVYWERGREFDRWLNGICEGQDGAGS